MEYTKHNHPKLYTILTLEACLCLAFYLFRSALPDLFSAVMAFPFEPVGLLLRAMSLSGTVGNVLAILLYLLIGLLPVGMLLWIRRKRKLCLEDLLLAVLSPVLFLTIYLMINPGLMGQWMGAVFGISGGLAVGKALLSGAVYSVLLSYVILRFLRRAEAADTGTLQGYLRRVLYLTAMILVFAVFQSGVGGFLEARGVIAAANQGSESGLTMTYLFLALRYGVAVIPLLADVLVVTGALELLDALSQKGYAEASVEAAGRLACRCKQALAVTVLSNTVFNLVQLLCARFLRDVHGNIEIPVLSIAFVLAALLLARLIRDNKQLQEDNDMFI